MGWWDRLTPAKHCERVVRELFVLPHGVMNSPCVLPWSGFRVFRSLQHSKGQWQNVTFGSHAVWHCCRLLHACACECERVVRAPTRRDELSMRIAMEWISRLPLPAA